MDIGFGVQAVSHATLMILTPPPLLLPWLLLSSEWAIPEEHFDTDRGSLLRFVAQRTVEVIREHSGGAGSGGPGSKPVVGFCFSFPVDQTALDNGKVVVWTKVREHGVWVAGGGLLPSLWVGTLYNFVAGLTASVRMQGRRRLALQGGSNGLFGLLEHGLAFALTLPPLLCRTSVAAT